MTQLNVSYLLLKHCFFFCLNDSSEISYHSVTTLADDEIELRIKRDLPVS